LQPSNDVGESCSSYDELASRSCFWTQKDPIRFLGGQTNIYVYAGDDPINGMDAGGLWYVDFNVGGGYWVGVTYGFQVGTTTDNGPVDVHPYVGFGVTTPGASGCVSVSQQNISTGWGWQVQGELGPAFFAGGNSLPNGGSSFGEVGAGWGLPAPFGANVNIYYEW
jgi:hypothetical protein